MARQSVALVALTALASALSLTGGISPVAADARSAETTFAPAPVVAARLLKAAGIPARYGERRTGGNHLDDVTARMREDAGTDFEGIPASDVEDYECAVARFLNADGPGPVAAVSLDACGTPLDFAQISTGDGHTCGITPTGKAYCWGLAFRGQLGDGRTLEPGDFTAFSARPVAVMTGTGLTDTNVAQISAGGGHTCAVTTTGKAYCWGWGEFNQLGGAGTDDVSIPTPVPTGTGLTDTNVARISAGGVHTCAITTTGKAYCWGLAQDGRLGNGDEITRQPSPVPVDTTTGLTDTNVAQITTGNKTTCAVTTTGKAYCWGGGFDGQLGTGILSSASRPAAVATTTGLTDTNVAQISVNTTHTCAVTTAGKAFCWGDASNGRLGDAGGVFSRTRELSPVAVTTGTGLTDTNVARISAGGFHTCALTTAGRAYCWGTNFNGQVGNVTPSGFGVDVPTAVTTGTGLTDTNVVHLSAGAQFTCATVTGPDGVRVGPAYCWGDGTGGQVGDDATENRLTPVAVAPPEDTPEE